MASPIPPILSAIVLESLKRSGHQNPSSDLQARATEVWLEEIKADLALKAKNLKAFQSKAITVLFKGITQYSNPSDYLSDMTMTYATGSRYGTADGGTASTVILDPTDTGDENGTIGQEIAVVSGVGGGNLGTVRAYNTGTKEATVDWQVYVGIPTAGDDYVIIDYRSPLLSLPSWDQYSKSLVQDKGIPSAYYPIGDTSNGKFVVSPAPWRDTYQPEILIHQYQSDLTEADTSGALMLTLYQKWRPLWHAGIRWKCLQNDDDNRAPAAFQEYQMALRNIAGANTYGLTLNELQVQVTDY